MNDIILTNENELPIPIQNRIVDVEKKIAELKEAEKVLKDALLTEMEKRNIKKIDTPKLTISYVEATTKEIFDSKSFRENHRDLYDEYAKISDLRAYVKIGVKDGD